MMYTAKTIFHPLILATSLLLVACQSGSINTHSPARLAAFTPEAQFVTHWSSDTGRGRGDDYLTLHPFQSGYRLIVPDYRGQITTLDTRNGKTLSAHRYPFDFTGSVSADEKNLFIGTKKAQLVAISLQNDNIAWKTRVGSTVLAAPAVGKHNVFVKSIDGSLTALNSRSGKPQWTITQEAPPLQLRAASDPVLMGKNLFVGFDNGVFAKLSTKDGDPLWKKQISEPKGSNDVSRMMDIDATPIVTKTRVYVANYHGQLTALSRISGTIIWQHPLSTYTGMSLAGNHLIVTDSKSNVWAFNTKTGTVLWRSLRLQYRDITAPTIFGNQVIVADKNGYIHALALSDGHETARKKLNSSGFSIPPLSDEINLYLVANNGRTYGMSLQS
jgi:outer membrane protein assembly factor BamB